jgi:hypothetical protein
VSNVSTMSITPSAIGSSVFILATISASATITATAVTGGSCVGLDGGASWTLIPRTTIGGTNINSTKLWLGVASSLSAANISITWQAGASFPCTTAQQFASDRGMGAGTPWLIADSDLLHNSAGATLAFPSIDSSAAGQLYCAYGQTSTAGSSTTAGSTTGGWVWQTDGYGGQLVYNPSIGPAGVAAPSATNAPSSETSDAIGVILTDAPPFADRTQPYTSRRRASNW